MRTGVGIAKVLSQEWQHFVEYSWIDWCRRLVVQVEWAHLGLVLVACDLDFVVVGGQFYAEIPHGYCLGLEWGSKIPSHKCCPSGSLHHHVLLI